MRAALYRGDGHVRVVEIERPQPATGEVRVSFSGVNPTEWTERRQPRPPDDRAFEPVDQDGGGMLGTVVMDV